MEGRGRTLNSIQPMTTSAIETVLAWHAALNLADVDWLLSLSTDDVEVGGPRGSGHSSELLRQWVARAKMHLKARRVFASGEVVVVDQAARWRGDDGQLIDPQDVASVFRVRDGRVSSVIRYPDLATALQAAGLEVSQEQLPGLASRALTTGADPADSRP
jgi:ketosteroid isomerase-like protein